jgi:hypothetical protein
MLIIGCDYHPSFQQIAFVDTDTGELGERRLLHREQAEQFYGQLKEQSMKARVGMEASGHARWFDRGTGSKRWLGRTECLTPTIHSEPRMETRKTIYESKMALFSERMQSCARRVLGSVDIVRDRDLQQLIS